MTTLQDPPVLVGSTTPRLWTPPLVTGPPGPCTCGCPLTPFTSLGFQAVEFAEGVLGVTLYPWQRWWLIHALELDGSGRFRFRTVLTLISRQCGKTRLLMIVALYFLYVGHAQLILGAAQSLDIARESWRGAVDLAESVPDLRDEIDKVLKSTVEYSLVLQDGSRYRITAANDKAGRGLSVDLLILDELRTHKDTAAWAALANTTMARPNSIIVAISNAGDDNSVVLNNLRAEALSRTDPTLALFEWSAPDGCALDDRQAWAQANPALGYGLLTEQKLLSAMRTARAQDFRCLDIATPVLTTRGWVSMGAVVTGDRVKGTSGRWIDVVGTSPVHYGKPCYRVTLNDGRSVICDEEHLWTVRDRRRPRANAETLRTVDLIARGVTYRNPSMAFDVRNYSLPKVAPLDGPDVDLPIDPYLLGLWLGDGSNHAAMIFVEDRDEEHVRSVMESRGAIITTRTRDSAHCWRLGFRTGGKVGDFTGALHRLGVHRNKHVPDVYFTASYAQRLELLRGLMDSDGTVRKTGLCAFTNTNGKLVGGVRTLVRSLGWKTSDREPGRYGKAHWLPRYDVCFTPRPDQPSPVSLPRKSASIRAARHSARDVRPITIVSVDAVPSVPVRCIKVDAPDSLFLAGDLVPTHNTENLCQRVDALDAAIDPQGWAACGDSELSLEDVKPQVCVGVEVAYDDGHVTAVAAAPLGDGRIGVEVLDAWASTQEARVALRELFSSLHPRAVAWFPQGHGTVLGPDLQAMHGEVIGSRMYLMEDDMRPECPGLVKVEQVPACEGLADLVDNRRLAHSDDQLLNAHVAASIRKDQGDGWRFARRGAGRNDAAYAAAGAVYLARTLPPVGDYDPLESVF
jgi:hypothetical protein